MSIADAYDARLADHETALQHARDLALRALERRDRTEAELRRLLATKRAEPGAIDQVLAELREGGYVDDAAYAERFAEDQRRLAEWGPDRIARKLASLGVAPELIEAALAAREPADEHEAALALLRRRFPQPPSTARDHQRALAMLVRKGYDLELAHDVLRGYAGPLSSGD